MKSNSVVILANGTFPTHKVPLKKIESAEHIICCDGATSKLIKFGMEPTAIVGDLDSLSVELKKKYQKIIYHSSTQETNDLTKAVEWCIKKDFCVVTIVGAVGKREDHTIGNVFLLPEYAKKIKVKMFTDKGIFTPILASKKFESYIGQQVSIFSMYPETLITTINLKYKLTKRTLQKLWQGTLNESTGENFHIQFDKGALIIFQEY